MTDTQKYLKWGIIGGVFLTLITPLIVANHMFFPYITGKNFLFRTIVEIIFALWAILAYMVPAYRPKKSLMMGAVAFFTVVVGLADALGADPVKSIGSNYERMEGYVTILHLFAYFLVVISVLRTEKLWERFFQGTLAVSTLVAVNGFSQMAAMVKSHTTIRLDATFGNAEYLGGYALIHTFIAVLLFVREKGNAALKWTYTALGLLNLAMVYYSATRGSILGLLFGVLVSAIILVLAEKDWNMVRKSAAGMLIAVVVLVGGFMVLKDSSFVTSSPVLGRFAEVSGSDVTDMMKSMTFSADCDQITATTVRSRCMVWNMAWQGFKERPILGWGQGNFSYVFSTYYNPNMYDQEPWFDRAHNIVFDWMVSGGILGVAGYLALFGLSFWLIWKIRRFSVREKAILTGLFVAYFFHNLFVFDNIVSYILFFSLLGYLSVVYHVDRNEQDIVRTSTNIALAPVIIPAVIVLAGASMYLSVIKPMQQNTTLLNALSAAHAGKLDESYTDFQKVLTYNTFGTVETREQLSQMTIAIIQSSAVPNDVKQKFARLALGELKKDTELMPNDLRAWMFLGTFLQDVGGYDDALDALGHAEKISPERQIIYMQEGSIYITKGDYKSALDVSKKAYDLAPAYAKARIAYMVAAVYAHDDALVKELKGDGPLPADTRLVNAYAARKDIKTVVSLWESIVAANPTNAQYMLSLAASYYQIGRHTDAINELEKAAAVDPSIADQVNTYIKEIKSGKAL